MLFIALANGSNNTCLYQAFCSSPILPFPKVLYNKPSKSSADGGIKN